MIKIDMEMPKTCLMCGMWRWSGDLNCYLCIVCRKSIDDHDVNKGRMADCPLIECKEDEKE